MVAIEPETGGILAMVSKPGYNPNTFVTGFSETEFEEIKNSVSKPFLIGLEGQYAPGSTFKPIVGLGGISFGLMDWDTIIDDKELLVCQVEIEFIETGLGRQKIRVDRAKWTSQGYLSFIKHLFLRRG